MPLRELFLSHYHQDALEVRELAAELRLRGIVPWVDKQGGFLVGDQAREEARRVIREDCFGLLLYATQAVFERSFIREVEMAEAREVLAIDPTFALFAVPRGIDFSQLGQLSRSAFGIDLSAFHTIPISEHMAFQKACAEVADAVLARVLSRVAHTASIVSHLSLQFSTRDILPATQDDALCIDATALLSADCTSAEAWARVLAGLRDIKKRIATQFGRPRLRIHGSKHLTAAFMFGRVFSPFELEIRQTPLQIWRTDIATSTLRPLRSNTIRSNASGRRLFVEVSSRMKDVAVGVDHFVATYGIYPTVRLQLLPHNPPLDVNNLLCKAMADQTYEAIEAVMQRESFAEIHLFVAAPQSYLMMLGRLCKGLPPVHLYEWNGHEYTPSAIIPAGVL